MKRKNRLLTAVVGMSFQNASQNCPLFTVSIIMMMMISVLINQSTNLLIYLCIIFRVSCTTVHSIQWNLNPGHCVQYHSINSQGYE